MLISRLKLPGVEILYGQTKMGVANEEEFFAGDSVVERGIFKFKLQR